MDDPPTEAARSMIHSRGLDPSPVFGASGFINAVYALLFVNAAVIVPSRIFPLDPVDDVV